MSDLNLTSFNPLFPMRIHQYNELFNDQNMNVMDKLNSVIDYLNQVGKLTNDVVKDWNTVYQWTMNDGLTTDVSNKIETMKANGELASIFGNTLIDQETLKIEMLPSQYSLLVDGLTIGSMVLPMFLITLGTITLG